MKKLVTAFLTLIFSTVTLLIPKGSAEETMFTDLDMSHDYVESIYYLKDNNVLHGFTDGTFRPNLEVSRGEFVKILVNSLYETEVKDYKSNSCFPDLIKNDELNPFICFAKEKGLISGFSDGTFKTNTNILFQEASKIVLKAYGTSFQDDQQNWEKSYLMEMSDLNNIPRTVSSKRKNLTRGEISEVIVRMLNQGELYDSLSYDESSSEIKDEPRKVETCGELNDILNKYSSYNYPIAYGVRGDLPTESAVKESTDSSASGSDYSTTNVQVAGVEEADVVKNDGEYLYMLRGNKVSIARLYPGKELKVLSTIDFSNQNFTPNNLYLNGDYLTVLGDKYSAYGSMETVSSQKIGILPYFSNEAEVRVYNISKQELPTLKRQVRYSGFIVSSRMIDDQLYLVLNSSPNRWFLDDSSESEDNLNLPQIIDIKDGNEVAKKIDCSDVSYILPLSTPQYLVTSSFQVSDTNSEINQDIILGNGGEIYASKDNIYITETIYNHFYYPEVIRRSYITPVPKTVIHKFALDNGEVKYLTQGKVDGTILNQFSMDESNGFFRIATNTTQFQGLMNNSTNHVFVLDENLKLAGKLTNLAKGEQIYSTRFIGKRLYMVTFKNVDPLFVIDLADPYNPKVLGELKIPGYSNYLHPYDETHLIGFGKEAEVDSSSGDFAWYQGMKIALFDVSDVNNPKELFNEVIGDRGTDSELLWNHKALLFNKDKNLLAFPVTVYEIKDKNLNQPTSYGEPVFQGAYIYKLDLQDGFQLEAKKTHFTKYPEVYTDAYYQNNYVDKNINRILYIKDNLYTISPDIVKSYDLETYADLDVLSF